MMAPTCCTVCGDSSSQCWRSASDESVKSSKGSFEVMRFTVKHFLELGDLLETYLSVNNMCRWWSTCKECGDLIHESFEIYTQLIKLAEKFQRNRKGLVEKCRNVLTSSQDRKEVCEVTKVFQTAIVKKASFGDVLSIPVLNHGHSFQKTDFVKEEVSSDEDNSEEELPSQLQPINSQDLETKNQSIKEEEDESDGHQDDVTLEKNVLVDGENQEGECSVDEAGGDEEIVSEKDFSGNEEDDEYHPVDDHESSSEEESESEESDESSSSSWRKRKAPSESGEDPPNYAASSQPKRKRGRPSKTEYDQFGKLWPPKAENGVSQKGGALPRKRLTKKRKQEVYMGIPGTNFLPKVEEVLPNPITNKLHCPKCDFRCVNKPVLQSHFTHIHLSVQPQDGKSPLSIFGKHPQTGRNMCPECDYTCSRRTTLNFHYHKVHLQKPLPELTYTCTIAECGKWFTQQDNFVAHMGKHDGTPRVQCPQCPQWFHSNKEQLRHVQVEHEGGRERKHSICEQCGKGFPSSDHLNSHRYHMHSKKTKAPVPEADKPQKPKPKTPKKRKPSKPKTKQPQSNQKSIKMFTCIICGISLQSTYEAKHLFRIHGIGTGTNEKMVDCKICGERLRERFERKHMYRMHGIGAARIPRPPGSCAILRQPKPPEVCELCGKSFVKSAMKVHMWNVHQQKIERTKWTCSECDHAFMTKAFLDGHLLAKHQIGEGTQVKWQCDVSGCRKKFTMEDQYKVHMEEIHGPDKKKPGNIVCRFCGKRFFKKVLHESHEANHFGVKYNKCDVPGCRAPFKNAETLKTHMDKVHGPNRDKPREFACRFCGSLFFTRNKLDRYEMIHENAERKPFTCPTCGKGFASPVYVSFHMVNTHKVEKKTEPRVSKVIGGGVGGATGEERI